MNNTPPGRWSAYGDGYGLLSDELDVASRLNNQSNVFVSVTYELQEDGSINVLWLTIANASDVRLFVDLVTFTSTGNPMNEVYTGTCNNLDQCYSPDPPRIVARGNDSEYFASIDRGGSSEIVSLVPSGYAMNPNNHFGPQSIQTVDMRIDFRLAIYPDSPFLIHSFFP